MDSELEQLFAKNFVNISKTFKQYLINHGYTSIDSLKKIPTEANALKIHFNNCAEMQQDMLLRRSFQMVLQEVNPEGAASEYVSISMTVQQLRDLRNSMGQNTGTFPVLSTATSSNQPASKAVRLSGGNRESAAEPSSHRSTVFVNDARTPVKAPIPSSAARHTAGQDRPQPSPVREPVGKATTAMGKLSVRDNPNNLKPAPGPNALPSSGKADPQQGAAQRVRDDPKPKPVRLSTVPNTAAFLTERNSILGRQIALGAEYDACTSIFTDPKEKLTFEIKKAADGLKGQEIAVFPFPDSICERLDLLGFNSNQKADFLVGLLQNKLATGLASEPCANSDEEKAIIHFRHKSHSASQQIATVNYQRNNPEATHVVVGVEYGTEVIFILTETKIAGQKSLMVYLTEVVNRTKSMRQGTSVGVESRFRKINCQAYSNFDEYQAKNFYQAVIIVQSLMMGEVDQKRPLTAIIQPIRKKIALPSQETLDEMERFVVMTMSTNRSLSQLKSNYPDLFKTIGIENLETAVDSMYLQVLNALQQNLIDVRRGTADEKSIVQFLRENYTKDNRQATLLHHAMDAINFILNKIQRPLQDAGISDKGNEPKIVLEIGIAPSDQYVAQVYLSSGDEQCLNNLFPWLHSFRGQKLEEISDFIKFFHANKGKEKQFCYRFKEHIQSSRLFSCIFESKGKTLLVPHKINGASINITPKTFATTSTVLSAEICWTKEISDRSATTTKTVPCQVEVCAIREGNGTPVEKKRVTLPNDIVFDGLRESTAYSLTHEVVLPDGFTLGKREWSKKFRTGESRAQTIINRSQPVENEPGFYELPKTVIACDEGFRKIQVGSHKINQISEKVILVVGGTGSGKSTFINAMANYLYEINFFNPCRLQLITKQDEFNECQSFNKAKSQTKMVSAYELNETRMPYRVTIVDTPGFGDTDGMDRDKLTMQYIKDWLERGDATGLQTIDAVCTVIKSNENRVTVRTQYELQLVQSLFGHNLVENMITAFSFYDGSVPSAIKALKEEKLLVGEAMINFNNLVLVELPTKGSLVDTFWRKTTQSFQEFFDIVDTFEPRSIVHTRDVLRHRKALEEQAVKFSEQITTQTNKVKYAEEVIEQLESGKIDLRQAQNFKIKRKRFVKMEIPVKDGVFTTFCRQCLLTCHEDCQEVKGDDRQRYNCNMMRVKDPNFAECTICPNRCVWTAHVHSNVILRLVERDEEITVAQVFEQYRIKIGEKKSAELLLELLAKDLLEQDKILGETIRAIRQHLNALNEIALRPGLTTDSKFLSHLIETEKQGLTQGSADRIAVLSRHLKIVKLIEQEQAPGGCLSSETESVAIAYLGHKFPKLYKLLDEKGYFASNSKQLNQKAVNPEALYDHLESNNPVFRSVSRNQKSNKTQAVESFKVAYPSLSAAAQQKLQEEADSASLSESESSSGPSADDELAERNRLIDQVSLTDDLAQQKKPKLTTQRTTLWKRFKKKVFSQSDKYDMS